MEYIKKEELKDGEIYYVSTTYGFWMIGLVTKSNNGDNSCDSFRGNATYIDKEEEELIKDSSWCYEAFDRTYRLATSEEKHWLNEAIRLNKFITFEEAIKTFIPEYVELLDTGCRINNNVSSGKIYKCSKDVTKTYHYGFLLDNKHRIGFNKNEFDRYLKPSTKEAYNAQFVVKEPEFVLPEKWYIQRNSENFEVLNEWENNKRGNFVAFNQSNGCSMFSDKDYYYTKPEHISDYTEITFEQFKKYVLKEETIEEVIEPLPQFKVIESIETITKVENNEGNQFFIGDVVKSLDSNQKGEITKFRYSADKSNIIAITTFQSNNGISINQIEHYIEPKTDYKILEYKTEGGISCKAPFLADSHQFYINERCKIYSIKRISDDLIITVGDEVLSKTCGVPNKILYIELINNKIRLYPRNSFYNLEDIIKVKLAY